MSRSITSSNSPSKVDRVIDTLGNQLRRDTIEYFEQGMGRSQASVTELVAHIGDGRPEYEKQRISESLYHTHLPKLAEDDWIDFDPEEKRIQYKGDARAESALKQVQKIFE